MRIKLRSVAAGAMQRARTRGLQVDPDLMTLTFELFEAQGARCALTGIDFDLRVVGAGQARRPFAPSLDRIDASGGYTRDNTRLVCQAVNFALNAFGEDIFREIALAAAEFDPEQVRSARAATAAVGSRQAPPETGREQKRHYIRHVVDEAPRILADRGGCIGKAAMRAELRRRYRGVLPVDEANAYGWGFRRLTETEIIEPASGSDFYTLRPSPPSDRTRRSPRTSTPTLAPKLELALCARRRQLSPFTEQRRQTRPLNWAPTE